jgi:hypothetical protein
MVAEKRNFCLNASIHSVMEMRGAPDVTFFFVIFVIVTGLFNGTCFEMRGSLFKLVCCMVLRC